MKEYPETHQHGHISIENIPPGLKTFDWSTGHGYMQGDFGVQIANDGRVWICIDGVAFLRFNPKLVLKGERSGQEKEGDNKENC